MLGRPCYLPGETGRDQRLWLLTVGDDIGASREGPGPGERQRVRGLTVETDGVGEREG